VIKPGTEPVHLALSDFAERAFTLESRPVRGACTAA
jgi:hypothetical protein